MYPPYTITYIPIEKIKVNLKAESEMNEECNIKLEADILLNGVTHPCVACLESDGLYCVVSGTHRACVLRRHPEIGNGLLPCVIAIPTWNGQLWRMVNQGVNFNSPEITFQPYVPRLNMPTHCRRG
jgi:hypothetical protein